MTLAPDALVRLTSEADYKGEPDVIPLDYPCLAEDAREGLSILLADGLFELKVESLKGQSVVCRVIEGGRLTSRKGVNIPDLPLRLPSFTEKDRADLLALHRKWTWSRLFRAERRRCTRPEGFYPGAGLRDACGGQN